MKLEFLFSREDVADLVSALYCAILDGGASSREQESRWEVLRERLKSHGLKGEEVVKEPQVTAIDPDSDFMHALELLARWPCWDTFLEGGGHCGTKCVCGSGWARKRLAELK